jgi:hypothetical protein
MASLKIALDIWFSKEVFSRSVKVALFVGTILAFINHGDLIINGNLTPECWFKMGLTCLVPYSVTTIRNNTGGLDLEWF